MFSAAALYTLTAPIDRDALRKAVNEHPFTPCGTHALSSMGWSPVTGVDEAPLLFETDDYTLLCLQIEEKNIPASAVTREVRKRVKEVEGRAKRSLNKNELDTIKSNVIKKLTTKALIKQSQSFGWINHKYNWIVVGEGTPKKAGNFISTLRKTLANQLPDLFPVITKVSGETVLTEWLKTNTSDHFIIPNLAKAVLFDPSHKATKVSLSSIPLYSEQVGKYLVEDHMTVKNLQVHWRDFYEAIIESSLVVKGIKRLKKEDQGPINSAGDNENSDSLNGADKTHDKEVEELDLEAAMEIEFNEASSMIEKLLGDIIQACGGLAEPDTSQKIKFDFEGEKDGADQKVETYLPE